MVTQEVAPSLPKQQAKTKRRPISANRSDVSGLSAAKLAKLTNITKLAKLIKANEKAHKAHKAPVQCLRYK